MLYNYQEIIVYMLVLPVVLNILLPLAMLVVWLVKQALTGKMLPSKSSDVIEQRRGFPRRHDGFAHIEGKWPVLKRIKTAIQH